MTLTVKLNNAELEAGLLAHAQSLGMTPEEYLVQLIEKDVVLMTTEPEDAEGSGMVWEDGLLVYGAGSVLPPGFLDNAVARMREERSRHILGGDS